MRRQLESGYSAGEEVPGPKRPSACAGVGGLRRGKTSGVGRLVPDRAATGREATPAVFRPAADLLTLPTFALDIPLVLEMGKTDTEYRLALIAEGLMRAGVVDDHHYMGSLAGESPLESAITAGLVALTATIGVHGAPGNLSLDYADDISAIDGGGYFNHRYWLSTFGGEGCEETQIGCFAICCTSQPTAFTVGERVLAMEREMGSVAWDIYRMLLNAYEGIMAAATPMWASDQMETGDPEYYEGWDLLNDVPEKALQTGWERRRINAMRIDSNWPEWMQKVAEDALSLCSLSVLPRKLRQIKTRRWKVLNHREYLDQAYSMMPLAIHWHREDQIDRLMDDNNEMTWQAEMTSACWMTCFDLSQTGREPGTLWWSIEALIDTLRTLAVASDILLNLHHDSRLTTVLSSPSDVPNLTERIRV